jgi:hypothetical protein
MKRRGTASSPRSSVTSRTGPPWPAAQTMNNAAYAEYLKYLKSHPVTRAQRLAYDRKKQAGQRQQPTRRTVQLASAPGPGEWILGGNDGLATCAAAAVANSLLLATGRRISDDGVLGLHAAAGGGCDSGTSVLGVLEAVSAIALGGLALLPVSGPDGVHDTGDSEDDSGAYEDVGDHILGHAASVILELALQQSQRDQSVWDYEPSGPWGPHAALLAEGHVITWGRAVPVTAEFLEHQVMAAWRVTWEAPDAPSR